VKKALFLGLVIGGLMFAMPKSSQAQVIDQVCQNSTPADNTTISGKVWVTYYANQTSPIAKVQLYIDGALASTIKIGGHVKTWWFLWDTTRYSNGLHTYTVKVVCADGDTATAVPFTVDIEN